MTLRGVISKIHCTLSANQKRKRKIITLVLDVTNTGNGERESGNECTAPQRKERGNNCGSVTVLKASFCWLYDCTLLLVLSPIAGLQCHPIKNINRGQI